MTPDQIAGLELLEWDWLYSLRAERLHHATLTDAQLDELGSWAVITDATVSTTCGRKLFNPSIPGVFSRMGMPRCQRCCVRVGYHQGNGSPKNDDTLRPLVEARIDARRGSE